MIRNQFLSKILGLLLTLSLLLSAFPLHARAAGETPALPDQPFPNQTFYKISLKQDGLVKVSYAALSAAGIPLAALDTLDPRTFQLYNQGAEMAIYVEGEANGAFETGEYFLFYGQKVNTRFSNTNVYWLTWGAANGVRMQLLDGTRSNTASVPPYFLTTLHLEQDLPFMYAGDHPNGPQPDHWYWDFVQGSVIPASKNFTFTLANIATGVSIPDGRVRGLLKGYVSYPKHHSQVRFNNNLVDDAKFDLTADRSFNVSIPQSWLVNGTNTFNVKVMLDVGLTADMVLVNWFEVDYYDRYVAENNTLVFEGDQAGTWEFQVSGFTTNDLEVYDITDPLNPGRITNLLVEAFGGGYRLRFEQNIPGERRYLALPPNLRININPLDITLDQPSDLHNTGNGADWIAISYGDFVDELQPLAAFRAAHNNYRVKVVDVQDVYDEFSGGVFDPEAIHAFLQYAYDSWTLPRPQFVLLNGDGHYDFKNINGNSTPNYLPPYLADVDPYMSETAADNRYVTLTINNFYDILPDIHLGRLPSRSGAETTSMVNKIIAYESNDPVGGWNTNVTFVADNQDLAGDFDALSNSIADNYLPAAYNDTKIYYGVNYADPTLTRNAILNQINQGNLLVSYIGHGSTSWWAQEQLLRVSDIGSMTNTGKLPFMAPMTCLEGYYINPTSSSEAFGEAVVRANGVGAVASFSPTGQGVATGHDFLERGLFIALFYSNITQLGAAADYARQYLYEQSAPYHRDLIDTYVLFGDPATTLQAAPNPTAVTLASFSAQFISPETIAVRWQTTLEVDLLGFNLYRAASLGGVPERLNAAIIPGKLLGGLDGADYEYIDSGLAPGEIVYYWLEAVDVHGKLSRFGPVLPEPQPRLHLPLIHR